VAILGGGIAGLTTALLLKEAGLTVAVLEARRILEGVTGNTTAKVTSLHEALYHRLIQIMGKRNARLYGEANQEALEWIARRVETMKIDCDFERAAAYTYAACACEARTIELEYKAAKSLGLPASLTDRTELPFPVPAAVSFASQAHFHPRKYLLPIAKAIAGDGSMIFEETTALGIEDGSPCTVKTSKGVIHAKHVVVATHQPFLLKGLFFARMHQKRSHVLGILLKSGTVPKGMYIGLGQTFHSLRPQPYKGKTMLLLGGEGHRTGEKTDTAKRLRHLEDFARKWFDVATIEYHWATQDNVTPDRVPYVGRLSRFSQNIFVATGFGGWGMTNATVAAMILCDLIGKKKNPWAALYSPSRLDVRASAAGLLKDNATVGAEFTAGHLSPTPAFDPQRIGKGEGQVMHHGLKKVAVSRDDDGTLRVLSATCTHLGCTVRWNNGEKSWDCPCHGSRFACDGKVLNGPAVYDLPIVKLGSKKRATKGKERESR
jgi:glycine/D-amino acid oxidase-like deaminating enzyme/nitrite reductase/ring-hydroxylating ferredoxin subunit